MADESFLQWPFFEQRHRELFEDIDEWGWDNPVPGCAASELDDVCRRLARALGDAGFLNLCVSLNNTPPDVRSLAVARQVLAYHSGLADFVFAMQGLGSGAISLFGSEEQKRGLLPSIARGTSIPAFALTEPVAGSDVANIELTARPDGEDWILDGEKTFISNAGIADIYVTFARTGEAPGAGGLSAFIVDGDAPGLSLQSRLEVIAPHPLGRLRYDKVRVSRESLIGEPGTGFKIAMQTLNLFRVTVGAAALGLARRALDDTIATTSTRRLGDGTLADNAVTQATLAEMALANDASALLIARAAWQQDTGTADNRRAAAMAKLHATESAQKVIDMAVQLHGGAGVTRGVKVEELYREIRALRIYEGASEVQRQIIARDLLKERRS